METWDIVVVGAGSAGMSAAIYAARFGLKVVVIGKVVGGLLNLSHNVENYPGFKSIPGLDLMMKFKEQCDYLQIPFKEEWVVDAKAHDYDSAKRCCFEITTQNDDGVENTYRGRTVILTTGTKPRKLGVTGEEKLSGKGVSYCATCDAAFFKNVPVVVVGGGDSAAQAGDLLAQFAKHVYIVVRKDKMRAEPINIKRLEENEKVTIIYNNELREVLGDDEVKSVRLANPYDGSTTLEVGGVFVEIGHDVQSELAVKLGAKINDHGEIIIDHESATNVRGVYAAGDVGNRKYKQAITGAAEGVVAAFSAYSLLKKIDSGEKVDIEY